SVSYLSASSGKAETFPEAYLADDGLLTTAFEGRFVTEVPSPRLIKRRQPVTELPVAPGARWLDRAECLLLLLFYGWLTVRFVLHFSAEGGLANLLLLPSEGLVIVFLLIRRRSTCVSRKPIDWLLAMTVTTAPLLAQPGVGSSA